MKDLKYLTVTTLLAVGLALGLSSSASAAPIPFGSDLAATPDAEFSTGQTYANLPGGSGAVSAGYVVPVDGVITGWRVKSGGPGATLVRFHVVRGNTSVYRGPTVDFGPAIGISATFAESVSVQQGDKIGLTNDSGLQVRSIFKANVPGATIQGWAPPLSANETRAPFVSGIAFSLLIQADLEPITCAGVNVTESGTAGADTIVGTAGDDVIAGLGGDDLVLGLGGNDILCGGDGNDTLKGGPGKDNLFGEAGIDKLKGGGAKDSCNGGPQKDTAKKCEKAKKI